MDPVMRIVLAVVGAFAGATLGAGAHFFDTLIGALAGFAIADLSHIRANLRTLAAELDHLAAELARGRPTPEPSAARVPSAAEATVTVAPPRPPPSPRVAAAASAMRSQSTAVASYVPAPAHRPMRSQEAPPNFIVEGIRGFVSGGNLLVRSGVIVLFFGIAFLLRYVAEHSRVPIEYRLSGVALGGLALLVIGWRVRKSRPAFGLAVQGGAVGILYLTVFAAFHLYALLPPVAAFALLTSTAVLSALLAIRQDSQSLALLGITGGFLAPVLASNGAGDHVFLFGYYAVLNAGIVLVAWFKSWRHLNLAGFGFTFGIGTVWGALSYRAADFASTEPFLILFFLFYVGIGVLFTWRQPPRLRGYVDGTLIFGTPLAAFGLQASMLHDRAFALGCSALVMSAAYLGLAALLKQRRDATQHLLIDAFLALGVVFMTIAAPLALGSRWNAGAWALEGGALVWIGCRQDRLLSRLVGALLIVAAGFLLANQFSFQGSFPVLPWNAYVPVLLVSVASMGAARVLFRFAQSSRHTEALLANLLFGWGVLWFGLGGLAELSHLVPAEDLMAAALTWLSLTALGVSVLSRKQPMSALAGLAAALFPIMLAFAAAMAATQRHPFEHGGWFAWPAAFVCFYGVLYRHETSMASPLVATLHIASAWLLIALSSWEIAWSVDHWVHGSRTWPTVAWAIVPTAALAGLARGLKKSDVWPLARHRGPYAIVAAGLAFALVLWSLVTEFSMTGDVAPLPYAPLLNPVDIVQLFVLLILWRCLNLVRRLPSVAEASVDGRAPAFALAALTFVWLNASLLRTLHEWVQVPWSFGAMLESTITQTSLSIFWATLALAAMLRATCKSDRPIWIAGAALLAATIGKLFFVDLSNVGSIERIVSFVGVGALMLVIGYYSPLPPQSSEPS